MLAWGTSYYFENKRLKYEKKSHAYGVFFKLSALIDDIAKVESVVCEAKARLNELKLEEKDLWRVTFETPGLPERREGFSASELSIITTPSHYAVVSDLMQIENSHRIVMSSYRQMIALKYQFHESVSATKIKDRTVIYEAEGDVHRKVMPILTNLEDISGHLGAQAPEFLAHAKKTAIEFCDVAAGSLKIGDFPKPKFNDEALADSSNSNARNS